MKSIPIYPGENGLAVDYNKVYADALGASNLLAHQMYGTLSLSVNPTNGQTLTLVINGSNIVITFVNTIGSTAGNVLIGANIAATLLNLINFLNHPQLTTATGVQLSAANAVLVEYMTWSFPAGGTLIVPSAPNMTGYSPVSSFNITTTVTGGSWTAQTNRLYVEAGIYFIAGTRYIFAGGVTPAVTAPASNPRIDVLSINASGTIVLTTGTEAASPSVPAYPTSSILICETYNVVGQTKILDNAYQTSGQGYIQNDIRPFLQYVSNPIFTLLAGQNISAGDAVYLPSGNVSYASMYDYLGVYSGQTSVSNTVWLGQIITGDGTKVRYITIGGVDSGFDSGSSCTVSIRAVSGGLPTGSNIVSTSTVYANAGQDPMYKLPSDYQTTVGVQYAVIISRTSAYNMYTWTTNPYAGGTMVSSSNSGSTWGAVSGSDLAMQVFSVSVAGQVYDSSANNVSLYGGTGDERNTNYVGIALAAATTGNPVSVQAAGIVTVNGTCAAGSLIYLSNTPGQVNTSPGYTQKKLGIGISSTQMVMQLGGYQ